MKEYITFDIGGTQIKYGIVSEIGIVLMHKKVPTEIYLGGEQIVQKLIYSSKKLMSEHTISGIGISNLAYIFNPKMIIIGGGITERGDDFLNEVKEGIGTYLNQEIYSNCEIKLAQSGNCAGMIGSIYHLLHQYK